MENLIFRMITTRINKVRASASHFRHQSDHQVGNIPYKVVSFKTNIYPSDVLETAKIFNMRMTNYDLVIPKKENRKGDHHSTEYFEDHDDKDVIIIEEDEAEDKRLSTFNSEATVGKLGTLKLRL